MPEKFGHTFDDKILKSPLTVGRTGQEPGPDVRNNPVAMPADPLKLVPGNAKTASK